MKKLVAFAMILSLGLFCAVGCQKEEKKAPPAKAAAGAAEQPKAGAEAPAPAKPAEEKPAPKK